MRCDIPAWGEDQEICQGGSWIPRLGRQDAKDGRVNMIHGDGTHVDELGDIVFVWDIVTVPSHDVERAVLLSALEKSPPKLVNDLPRIIARDGVLGLGMEEITRVGETVRSQGAKFWQLKVCSPDLQDVASGRPFHGHLEPLASLDDANLTGLDIKRSELGLNVQSTLLWNNEKITVRIHESTLFHALRCGEDVGSQSLT